MPIRSLDAYLRDLKAVSSSPLDVLENAVVGIDAEHYVGNLLANKEPTLEAIGGFPTTISTALEMDLQKLRQLNIKPVFVFPGLLTAVQFSYVEQADILPQERTLRRMWDQSGAKDYHTEAFRDPEAPLSLRPLMPELMQLLDDHDIEYVVSPYASWAQLQYLLGQKLVNCVYGSSDGLLLDGVDKIITRFDFASSQFHYWDTAAIVSRLGLSPKQFRDISMCVGNVFQPFALNIFPHIASQNTFQTLHHFVLSGRSVYNALLALANEDPANPFQLYIKGCVSVRYMPVLKKNGRVEPLQLNDRASFLSTPGIFVPGSASSTGSATVQESAEKVPDEMHEFIGQRLPDEMLFYQSVGLTVFELAETLIHSNAVERLPLDMALTPLYSRLVTGSAELRGHTLNVLATAFNRYYQFKKLQLTTVFNGQRHYELVQKMVPPLYTSLRPLLVRHATARAFDLQTLLSDLTDDFLVECTYEKPPQISSNHELVSTALVRSLVMTGFVGSGPFKLTEWGTALSYVAHSFNPEYLLLVLFLLKQTKPSVAELLEPSDFHSINKENTKSAVLISKFLALFPLKDLHPVGYTYKISRPLLQFRSVADKANSMLAGIVKTNLVALLLQNQDDLDKFQRSAKQWRKLALELPFSRSLPSVLLGIVSQHFFERYLEDYSYTEAAKAVQASFQQVHSEPMRGLVAGLKAFKELVGLVRILGDKKLVAEDVAQQFAESEALVDRVLQEAK